MNVSMAKKTQDTLGRVIKKPPLTEKLLSKPPFRYLHDILNEVIRTTGFMRGLYVEAEMKSDNVKDKDAKIAFLQKAIDVVVLVSGESLLVKPVRIVAGHEPEKTNELLQAIGRCCLKKLSSDEAVQRVLAGDKPDLKGKPNISNSQDKENQVTTEQQPSREERKEIKDSSSSRDRKDPEQPKDQGSRRSENDSHKEGERQEKDKRKETGVRQEKDRRKEGERVGEGCKLGKAKDAEREGKSRDREREREKAKKRDSHRDGDRVPERRRNRGKETDKKREPPKDLEEPAKESEPQEREPRGLKERQDRQPAEQPVSAHAEPGEPESPTRIPHPASAKGQRRHPKPGEQEADTAERSIPLENSSNRASRPNSARPAPPRIRRQENHPEVMPAQRLGSAKPSSSSAVIVEESKLSENEEDEEHFVVDGVAPHVPDMPELEPEPAVELREGEKHGGLVRKILDTKKDYETSPSPSSFKDQERALASEVARSKELLVSREMERLRSSAQTVCRSALPLGKVMEYVQEDVDSMQKELEMWRHQNREHALALLREQRITDSAVEPLKAELAELERLIRDQQDKICAVKSSILHNEEKIQKMVSAISFSART
ncbi:hypothetical protein AAFF_G00325690 [Aldrovandia affinis]|uniref:TRAF3-interacting protein 1 n=1 Tax=Aldrovandia affinis TaxID=143900 RepID=A0AAD7TAR1_9TELE|nr:hypothetical protein AAFF_G00325690 [Aldrovandia affinis]